MSFSRPQRASGAGSGALRHSRSTSTLTGLNQARRNRNCFQRQALRPSHSTQCLFAASDAVEEADAHRLTRACTTVTTATCVRCGDGDDVSFSSDSEYSEYDLVNEQIQDFLLDSAGSSDDEDADTDGVVHIDTFYLGGFVPPPSTISAQRSRSRRRVTTPERRHMAKKSESCVSLSSIPRLTPSTSTTLLSDMDNQTRDRLAGGGTSGSNGSSLLPHRSRRRAKLLSAQLRNQQEKQHGLVRRRSDASDRRWLVPPMRHLRRGDDGPLSSASLGLQAPLFTVVLDLDETLVGARYGTIHCRPHVADLLRCLHQLPVEIIVWTAGTPDHVNPILHAIGHACGRREWFHHIISRHKRWYTGANTSIKDLCQLGRPLDRVLMVENNPISALRQPALSILVEDYLQADAADASLLEVKAVLERLVHACLRAESPSEGNATVPWDANMEVATARGHAPLVARDVTPAAPLTAQFALSTLLDDETALQTVDFRMEDICNERGVSMNQKVEMVEHVRGAATLPCRVLRYSPSAVPASSALLNAAVSVAVRSYGCIHPMPPS